MKQEVRNESNKFHDMLLLESLNNLEGRSDVFIKIYSIHNIESINKSENVVIKASLMNEKMFYLDKLNLFPSTQNMDDKYQINHDAYHPYFFEFESDAIHDKSIIEKIKKYRDQWMKGMIIFDDHDIKQIGNIKKKTNFKLTGNIIFAASPIIRKKGKIFSLQYNFTEDEGNKLREYDQQLDKILDNYKFKPKQNERIKEFIKLSTNDLSGVIYGVGQGNFIKLNCGKKVILFDIGFTISEDHEKNLIIKNSSEMVYSIKPNMIILSHWDLDHIIGVTYMKSDYIYSTENFWIAPFPILGKTSVSAKRLCVYLIKFCNVYLIKNKFKENVIGNDNFTLWRGEGTDNNDSGLLLTLQMQNPAQAFLFAGDCSWEKMPKEIFEKGYRFLVVSHHGSKQKMPEGFKGSEKKAYSIICTGKNTYGHPHVETIEQLNLQGFANILFTVGIQAIYFWWQSGKGVKAKKCYTVEELEKSEKKDCVMNVDDEPQFQNLFFGYDV